MRDIAKFNHPENLLSELFSFSYSRLLTAILISLISGEGSGDMPTEDRGIQYLEYDCRVTLRTFPLTNVSLRNRSKVHKGLVPHASNAGRHGSFDLIPLQGSYKISF